jgi:signal peptidase II
MTMSDTHDVIDGLLKITYTRNAGAAFSVGEGMTAVFGLVAIAVVVAIVRTARSLRSLTWAITLGLLLGGAIGNLGDRVFRSPGFLRGHVVDWIELPHWPVFNLADASIVCGGVLAVLLASRGLQVDGTVQRDEPDVPPAGTPAAPAAPAQATEADHDRRGDGPRPDAKR